MKMYNLNIKKFLIISIITIVVAGCNSGGSATPSNTPTHNDVLTYGIGDNGLYLNTGSDAWYKVDTTGIIESQINSINCNSGICAAATSSGLELSNDFITWKNVNYTNQLNNKNLTMTPSLYSTIVVDEESSLLSYVPTTPLIVAVGQGGLIQVINNAATQLEQYNKTNLTTTVSNSPTTNNLYQVIQNTTNNSSQLISVGAHGTILSSIDNANTWKQISVNTINDLYALSCNGNICIVVGSNGTILQSNDSINWNIINANTTSNLYAIANINNMAVIGGANGTILFSNNNGLTWNKTITPPTIDNQSYNVYNITYDGTQFIASIAYNSNTHTNITLSSQDGITWSVNHLLMGNKSGNNNLNGFIDDFIWGVGEAGRIMQSFVPIVTQAAQMGFMITGFGATQ